VNGNALEEALAALLYDEEARARWRAGEGPALLADLDPEELEESAQTVRRMLGERRHRGTGGVRDWYPRTLAAWVAAHARSDDESEAIDQMLRAFGRSPAACAFRESPAGAPGLSLEEALGRFFEEAAVGDPAEREEEMLAALVRGLAVAPQARFVWPEALRAAPGGCFALSRRLVLHAAIDGQYLCGPVTPLVARVLAGEAPSELPAAAVEEVRARLRALRILP
jgi:hypothetical protein